MNNCIEVKDLVKEYKELRAIDHLSFEVKEGEIFGLLGPNGSGKSTTMNCLLSLLKYQEGQIKIFGQEMKPSAYELKRRIGVVFQDVAVFEELTVYENIDYFCGLYIKDKETRKQYVQDALDLVALNDYVKFVPKKLSGGLLRRLNIACGIAHKPDLIFLDEPTVAVDPQSRNNILDGILTLNKQGAAIVYTTHYMEEVEIICDRIMILDKGKIIAQGTKEELKNLVTMDEKVTVELDKDLPQEILAQIQSWEMVHNLSMRDKILEVQFKQGNYHLSKLVIFLKEKHIPYHKIYSELPTLNDVFLELTGKELRD
ncbi:MAG: ABC transporter ATP-binding protein [Firmicutes bacterium]|nr:ABC transporter ATP-binding protein [Bacillota bacterium]